MDALRTQTDQERKMRASVAMKISENIAQERESLVKELDMLRSINTKVRQHFQSMIISHSNGFMEMHHYLL